MARPSSKHPTKLELEILKILWQTDPLSVREVRDMLRPKRALNSVQTTLNIMVDKGYLRRSKPGGVFVYKARVGKQATTRRMLKDLVARAFDGSTAAAMVNLIETGDIDAEELDQIRRLISEKTKE